MNYVVFNSSKCFYYRIYKTDHKFEKYFDIIDGKLLRSFVNFRMCNNVLPIEKGRWKRQDINNRNCTLCNTNEVGDECHYISKCPLFTEDRNSILPTRLCRNPNKYTVQNLMNTVNKKKLLKLCKFISIILYHVKNLPDFFSFFSILFFSFFL